MASLLQKYLNESKDNIKNSGAVAYLAALDHIGQSNPGVVKIIIQELKDQRSNLKLIASENFSSLAVQLSMGNLLTDKYAEGYPYHRFYAGCDNVDALENAAVEELKQLFGAEAAYVQPHSGADANLVAYWAILYQKIQTPELEKLGKKSVQELSSEEHERIRHLMLNQKVMGLSLNSGGHLTHGYRLNVSSKMMQAVGYDVDPKTELIDYKMLKEQVLAERPAILLAGYSAYPRKINFAIMREIADAVSAVLMVDMAHFSGLVAGKVFTGDFDPIPHAHIVTSTTHKTLRGPRGGVVLCKQEFAEVINKGCPIVLGGPLPHVIAAKLVAFREANTPEFRTYAHNIVKNAGALAERLQHHGIRITSGGTENHLIVMDLTKFGLTGLQGEAALRESFLTVNRNAIPFDKNGAWYTSGVRIGTPATTTLGMGPAEMHEIADIIADVLTHAKPATTSSGQPSKTQAVVDPKILKSAQDRATQLLKRYPLYPELVVD